MCMRNLNISEIEGDKNAEEVKASLSGQDDSPEIPSMEQSDLNDIENEGIVDLNVDD